MDNNDLLIRLRYALDIKNTDMIKIFALGGIEVTKEEVFELLTKTKEIDELEEEVDNTNNPMRCNDRMFESFLNGFITFKRGKQEPKPGQEDAPVPLLTKHECVNNVLLKKLKIALSLTSEDMIEILAEAGITITKGELSALLRKVGHKNYKQCGDKYARNFLKGLAVKYRV